VRRKRPPLPPEPADDTDDDPVTGLAGEVIAELTRRGLTIAIAESLTGGLIVAELIGVPGASKVVNGGIVAYNTELKHSLLGVDADFLAARGPVDPDVAAAMADGVRRVCSIEGVPASIGLSTTGVAGPDPQDGKPVGTVFIGVSTDAGTRVVDLTLGGSRNALRRRVVSESLVQLKKVLTETGT
jgi:nicotinamide-nucleotide amidase